MRREEREVKQERSISVQGRVDIVELAELCVYFEREGVRVKSMSQLVGWSISLLREVMSRNGMIREIGSIARAHQLFEERGLYQRALKSRNMQKIATAVRFEGMRESGYDPIETGRQFGVLHNENSVVPFDVEKVRDICDEYHLWMIEDVCDALGTLLGKLANPRK